MYIERHTLEGAVQNVGADQRDAVSVFCGEQRSVRVMEPDGDIPTATSLAAVQINQKSRGIVCVGGRIESFVQSAEGVGMVMQIDLHATDIDEGVAKRLLS
jgi:hypothetical protein